MRTNRLASTCLCFWWVASLASAADISVGAAPKGDATAVASRIIKYNFPACTRISKAARREDGSIRANCDGTEYLVFTIYSASQGKMIEVAMNCTAAKSALNVSCL
jgi:hypothetical protein